MKGRTNMLLTLFLAIVFCEAITLMLLSAVAFIQDERFFSSAPKEAQAVIQPRTEELFYGARIIGWTLMAFSLLMILGVGVVSIKAEIRLAELADFPIMISRASQSYWESAEESRNLKIFGTYNLIFNASLLVESGACCALGFEKLINTTGESPLCFRPLAGQKKTAGALIWKKYQTFSPAVQLFIERIKSHDMHSDPFG